MHPVPHRCPICYQGDIMVTKMTCPRCESELTGQFTLHRLNRLTASQLQFVEIFLLNEGKINRVEQEMALSYASVRARLQEIVEVLGGSPAATDQDSAPASGSTRVDNIPADPEQRKEILARVSSGELSASEAVSLLSGRGSAENQVIEP